MHLKPSKAALTLIIFIKLPLTVFANAGSPLMFFGVFHLIIANFIIGVSESNYLKQLGVENKTWLVVIGNYISMAVGLQFVSPTILYKFFKINFWTGENFSNFSDGCRLVTFFLAIVIAFIITLIVEFPFVYYSINNKESYKNLKLAFLKTNILSYIAMTIVYFIFVLFEILQF